MPKSSADRALLAAALLVVAFYLWTASNGVAFPVGQPQDGYYNRLADSFRHGQLSLREEPREELFELAEPYEPGRNEPFRLHDASLWKGKYYLYFGAVPAVVLFLPWSLVGLGALPESLAAALLASGGYVMALLLLRHLVRRHLPGTPAWMQAGAALVLGLASAVPFVLRGPSVYEVAITGGFFFSMLAVWSLLGAGDEGRPHAGRLVAGGLSLGLAVGCRPNLVVAVPLLLVLAWPALRDAGRGRGRAVVQVLAPFLGVIFLLGLYNVLRFGAWTEFGARYQVGGMRPVGWLDVRAVPVALYFHFLAPPDLRLDFPFVFPLADYPGTAPEGFFKAPFTTGALAYAPFLLILAAGPWILRGARVEAAGLFRVRLWLLVSVGLLVPVLTSFAFSTAAMRFEVDFLAFLAIPALLLWLALARRLATLSLLRTLAVLSMALVLLVWSCGAGMALSLHGDTDAFRLQNPQGFAALERRFEPLRIGLGRAFVPEGRGRFRMRVAFPERLAGETDPLLSSGTVEAHDVLRVAQRGPGVFACVLEPVTGPRQESAAIPIEPGRFYDVDVDLDHVGRTVVVTIDGREACAFRARVGPVHRNRLWYSRGPRGRGAASLGRFAGSILPEPMLWAGRPGLESLPPIAPLGAIHTDAKDDGPAAPAVGQLWIPATTRGAYLWTGAMWRWIPRSYVDRLRVERRVNLGERAADEVEPVVVTGEEDQADAVYVRRLPGGRVAFGLARWRGSWSLGPAGAPVAWRPGESRTLSAVIDRVEGLVRVDLDGHVVLEAPSDLAPLDRERITVGRTPEGMALGAGALAATIEPAAY